MLRTFILGPIVEKTINDMIREKENNIYESISRQRKEIDELKKEVKELNAKIDKIK